MTFPKFSKWLLQEAQITPSDLVLPNSIKENGYVVNSTTHNTPEGRKSIIVTHKDFKDTDGNPATNVWHNIYNLDTKKHEGSFNTSNQSRLDGFLKSHGITDSTHKVYDK